jgi:hypothetical protein
MDAGRIYSGNVPDFSYASSRITLERWNGCVRASLAGDIASGSRGWPANERNVCRAVRCCGSLVPMRAYRVRHGFDP